MILRSDILDKVTEKQIMEYYYNCSIIDKKAMYKNKLRNDNDGTCYFNWYRNRYFLVDRGRGKDSNFDCFQLVMSIYNCNYSESLVKINKDLNLNISSDISSHPGRKTISHTEEISHYQRKINYQIKARKWNQNDIDYWNTFKITLSTLIYYNVIAVDSYKSDAGESFKFKPKYKYNKEHIDPCYAYVFKGKKSIRVKLYRPLNPLMKWQGNINNKDIFGYSQLPEYSSTIYIASGLKDLMCLHEMGFTAIAPQSESSVISPEFIEDIKSKCKRLVILFDNDNAGVEMAKKFSSIYQCRYLILPKNNDSNCKDVAEFVTYYGLDETKEIIKKCKLKI